MANRTCSIPGCNRTTLARGWCRLHYDRWKRTGDPAALRRAENGAPLAWLTDAVQNARPDTCILWPDGWASRHGYGVLLHNGKPTDAHRVALALAGRPVPEGLEAAHQCPGQVHSNRRCVNPHHLLVKDRKGNAEDMARDGASQRGEKHTMHKLTAAEVLQVCARYDSGETPSALAADYGVTRRAIWKILYGERWGWLTGRGQRPTP